MVSKLQLLYYRLKYQVFLYKMYRSYRNLILQDLAVKLREKHGSHAAKHYLKKVIIPFSQFKTAYELDKKKKATDLRRKIALKIMNTPKRKSSRRRRLNHG